MLLVDISDMQTVASWQSHQLLQLDPKAAVVSRRGAC